MTVLGRLADQFYVSELLPARSHLFWRSTPGVLSRCQHSLTNVFTRTAYEVLANAPLAVCGTDRSTEIPLLESAFETYSGNFSAI